MPRYRVDLTKHPYHLPYPATLHYYGTAPPVVTAVSDAILVDPFRLMSVVFSTSVVGSCWIELPQAQPHNFASVIVGAGGVCRIHRNAAFMDSLIVGNFTWWCGFQP